MRSLSNFAIAAWLVLSVVACAKTTDDEDGIGTNTNWLRSCDEQADCGDEEACLCGVCTKPCEDTAECGDLNAATTCQALTPNACGTSSTVTSACLQGCQTSGDCTAFQDGLCVSGLCIPRPAPARDASVITPSMDASVVPSDASINADPYTLTRREDAIQITPAYTACQQNRDCALVETTCSGCCGRGAVLESLRETYDERMTAACAGYQGFICDCEPPDVTAVCVNDRCKTIPTDQVGCISPADDEGAYDGGARGCDCEHEGQGVCTQNAALVCTTYDGGTTWWSVEDGPCEPVADTTCQGGGILPTPESCVALFLTCRRLPNGEYCGTDALPEN